MMYTIAMHGIHNYLRCLPMFPTIAMHLKPNRIVDLYSSGCALYIGRQNYV